VTSVTKSVALYHLECIHIQVLHFITFNGCTCKCYTLSPSMDAHASVTLHHLQWMHMQVSHFITFNGCTCKCYTLSPSMDAHASVTLHHLQWMHMQVLHFITFNGCTYKCYTLSPSMDAHTVHSPCAADFHLKRRGGGRGGLRRERVGEGGGMSPACRANNKRFSTATGRGASWCSTSLAPLQPLPPSGCTEKGKGC